MNTSNRGARALPTLAALAAVLAAAACGSRPDPATPGVGGTVNPASTLDESTSSTPEGQADVEEPQTQTNTGRPDSPRDLQPGTDGNSVPPPSP